MWLFHSQIIQYFFLSENDTEIVFRVTRRVLPMYGRVISVSKTSDSGGQFSGT
jgi:hypothetical protein